MKFNYFRDFYSLTFFWHFFAYQKFVYLIAQKAPLFTWLRLLKYGGRLEQNKIASMRTKLQVIKQKLQITQHNYKSQNTTTNYKKNLQVSEEINKFKTSKQKHKQNNIDFKIS